MVSDAGKSPRNRHAGERDHRDFSPAFNQSRSIPARPRLRPPRSTTTATACLHTWRAALAAIRKAPGTVKSERVLVHNVVSPFWTGPLRSPARLQNTFAHECFMDELASKVKADPVEYRVRHLSHARLRDMVLAAAKAANWDTRPSPKPGLARTGIADGPRHCLRGLRGR